MTKGMHHYDNNEKKTLVKDQWLGKIDKQLFIVAKGTTLIPIAWSNGLDCLLLSCIERVRNQQSTEWISSQTITE